MTSSRREKQAGFTLLVTAASAFVLVGMLGLAVDFGRIYIVKNEAQAFSDFAALAAARRLNGTSAGITAANAEVANSTNKWNFNTQAFPSGIQTVEYAIKPAMGAGANTCPAAGPWVVSPASATNYGCVRVTVAPTVNLIFLPMLGTVFAQTVRAQAVAGVVPESFVAGGYLPFTPFAHEQNCSATVTTGCDTTGNYGFSIGQEYTMLWPSNIKNAGSACAGDQTNWPLYNVSDQVGGGVRGYFTLQSASSISAAIQGTYQVDPLSVGDQLSMSAGQKNSEQNALNARDGFDTDQTNYAPDANGTAPPYSGNGMRLIVMPINDGPNASPAYAVLGFASFLLYPNYSNHGNQPWCAIYMGSTTQGGTGSPYTIAGAYAVRLTQ